MQSVGVGGREYESAVPLQIHFLKWIVLCID